MTSVTVSEPLKELMDADITSSPTKIMPMLPMICPARLTLSLPIIDMNAPTHAIAAKNAVTGRDWSATICAVTVVPMLAPMMIAVACLRVMTPALTKPTTMTVVADELWMIAVTPVPTAIPAKRLELILLKTFFSLLPAMDSRFSLMILSAIKNTPKPPSKVSIISTTVCIATSLRCATDRTHMSSTSIYQ